MLAVVEKVFGPDRNSSSGRLKRSTYEAELGRLQIELVKLQGWVRAEGRKVVVLFEGRDAAGKGGVITRITEVTSPRIVRVVALGTPSDRQRTQWYFQRYVEQLPAAGEVVLVPEAARHPDQAMEAVANGHRVTQPVAGLLAGQGPDVRPHRHR